MLKILADYHDGLMSGFMFDLEPPALDLHLLFQLIHFFMRSKYKKKMCRYNKKVFNKKNSRQSVDLAGSLRLTHIQNLNRTSVRYHQCKLAHWFRNDNNPSHKRLEIWIQNSKAFGVQKQLILPEILLIIQYMQTW